MLKKIPFILFISFIIFILTWYSTIHHEDSPIFINSNKAKNCEDPTIKNMVIEIFKENSQYYASIDKNSIADITLLYPASLEYDKEIDRYSCSGTIEMKSGANGFKPILYDTKNEYYSLIYNFWDNTLKEYTHYKTDVKYYSQISEGQILVQSTTNYDYVGNFNCDGPCILTKDPTYIEKQTYKNEDDKKKEDEEHINLPF
jgi:hypothetical protein